ncbi:hypothetical protein GmHk_04G011502 [Glycine max]|nr:hypothetical protein GmHk_04G011502 [Glycine max]
MLAGSRLFKEEVLTGKNYKASDQASFPSKIVFLCYGGFISSWICVHQVPKVVLCWVFMLEATYALLCVYMFDTTEEEGFLIFNSYKIGEFPEPALSLGLSWVSNYNIPPSSEVLSAFFELTRFQTGKSTVTNEMAGMSANKGMLCMHSLMKVVEEEDDSLPLMK